MRSNEGLIKGNGRSKKEANLRWEKPRNDGTRPVMKK